MKEAEHGNIKNNAQENNCKIMLQNKHSVALQIIIDEIKTYASTHNKGGK